MKLIVVFITIIRALLEFLIHDAHLLSFDYRAEQVIESVFQQDRGQAGTLENLSNNILVGKGQATAMTALKELRKISNLLSEM